MLRVYRVHTDNWSSRYDVSDDVLDTITLKKGFISIEYL